MNDGNGHGTHVAGTAAGHTYGVSYCSTTEIGCKLCAVKVLTAGGSGSYSGVAAGIDHTAANCQAQGKKCVLNMSLGGPSSTTLDNAVKNAVEAGVTVVVAAGNESTDACTKSPAGAESAITVGSTEESYSTSSFSNYGSCVDIWQPGSYIKSAWIGSSTSSTRTISGTSMASPRE